MLFKKVNFENYWDRIWDACTDTGVGEPLEAASEKYKDYFKTVIVPSDYKDFAMWLYAKGFNVDKEVEFFNKKYLNSKNSREASYQVLTYEFEKWIDSIWDSSRDRR